MEPESLEAGLEPETGGAAVGEFLEESLIVWKIRWLRRGLFLRAWSDAWSDWTIDGSCRVRNMGSIS